MRVGPNRYRKTCKRYDVEGHGHFLTFSCFRNQSFFRSARACRWFLDAIEAARAKHAFDLWAYVIMPEHVHLLLLPPPGSSISHILKSIKVPVGMRASAWVRKNAPAFLQKMADRGAKGRTVYRFWQRGGGYDRNIWTVEELHEKLRYIHLNPLRRGLVTQLEDWPWSSSHAWEHETDEPIRIDRETFPPLQS